MTKLDELEALLAKATPGPWRVQRVKGCRGFGPKTGRRRQAQISCVAQTVGLSDDARDANNAALIAAAVNALPELLAVARAVDRYRYDAEIDRALAALDALRKT